MSLVHESDLFQELHYYSFHRVTVTDLAVWCVSGVPVVSEDLCNSVQWVMWRSPAASRGPSCFSNSSWSNRQRHPAMRRHSPISWMSATSNALWLAEQEFHKLLIGCFKNHMTAYANGLYVAVEIPECWAALHWEAARERGGRRREGGVTAACTGREKLFQQRSWRLLQSSVSFSPRRRFILYPMSAAR